MLNKGPIILVMNDEVGDKGYYYNKNDGLVQQAFDGLDIDEMRLRIEILRMLLN